MANLYWIDLTQSSSDFLVQGLREQGLHITLFFNVEEAHQACLNEPCDLMVLKVLEAPHTLIDIVRELHRDFNLPMLIFSQHITIVDKALLFEAGADEILPFTINMLELNARIKSLLRRASRTQDVVVTDGTIAFGHLVLHFNKREIYKDHNKLELTHKEYAIFELLYQHLDVTLSKQHIYERVWKKTYQGKDNSINVHMRRLREKIETNANDPKLILTVWGYGYRMNSEGVRP